MQTTEQDLLQIKKGEWIKINPLRDINQIKKLTNNLLKHNEEFVFNDEGTHFFRRVLDPFDNRNEVGYRVEKKPTEYGKFAEELFYNGKLIAIR